MRRIALIAGHGKLPFILADEAKRRGEHVVGIAINGITEKGLESHVDKIYWGDAREAKKALEIFRQERIGFIVMTGKIPRALIFDRKFEVDKDVQDIFRNSVDNKDYSIFKAVALRLRREGIRIIEPTRYFSDLIPKKGQLSKRSPTDKEWEDISFGKKIAKKIAGMDIGQAVVVKKKSILAIEALEGTDKTIRRAGALSGEGAVVVKVARPRQDMNFDIPTIGPETIDSLIDAKAAVLAIEAKKTIVVDRDEVTRKADTAGISIIAI